jgi:branched-subunit amino acid transport protein
VSAGIWLMVALLGAVTITLRISGPLLLGDRELPAPLRRTMAHLAPAVLAALIVSQILTDGHRLVLDARLAGLAAAAIALLLRAPVLLVIVTAVVVTAVVRALG